MNNRGIQLKEQDFRTMIIHNSFNRDQSGSEQALYVDCQKINILFISPPGNWIVFVEKLYILVDLLPF